MVHFVGTLIAPVLDSVTLPIGFKVRVVLSLSLLLACMQYIEPWVSQGKFSLG